MAEETKVIYLLNIGMKYAPEICALTYPLIHFYANKIGADVDFITDRKFPSWPIVYEKLQIYDLERRAKHDRIIYIDSDTLVHPECIDFTSHLSKDTVCHNGADMAGVRWTYDNYFRRDGRNLGSCNWMTIASDWCLDLWHPLEDLTLAEALENIHPVIEELNTVITKEHLIDDYVLSRNIARFGLKFITLIELFPRIGLANANFLWHQYQITIPEKIEQMKAVLEQWKIPEYLLEPHRGLKIAK